MLKMPLPHLPPLEDDPAAGAVLLADVATPPGVVTVTGVALPPEDGMLALIEVVEVTVKVAMTPPMYTPVAPPRLVPVMVTVVPPVPEETV